MLANALTVQRLCVFAMLLLPESRLFAQAKLTYQHRAGDVQQYVMSQVVTVEMMLPGQPNPVVTKTDQTTYLKVTTDEVDSDGTAKQRQEFTRVVLAMTLPGPLNFEYDTASTTVQTGPLADRLVGSIKPLIHAEMKQTVDAQGNVLELVVPDALVQSLRANPNAATLGELGTPEGLKKLSKYSAVAFPVGEIMVGATWEQFNDTEFPFGKMTTTSRYEYLGPENGLEKVGIVAKLAIAAKEGSGVNVRIASSEGVGQVLFNNRDGWLQENKMTQVVNMVVTAGGQTINQKVVTEVMTRRVETDGK